MFFIYGILSSILFIVILPFWLLAGVFKRKLVAGFLLKCGIYQKDLAVLKQAKPIIFYGVSVGEVNAMENLIKKTRENFPDIKIVVMTGTLTGQEIAQKKLSKIADFITYFPFDIPFAVNNMVKKINPRAIFVMETELWPNFAKIMQDKKIPLYIINGRISDRTYKSYKKLSFFFKPILKKYTGVFTQSVQDNEKLISIGSDVEKTTIMGNLKFDVKMPDCSSLSFSRNPEHLILLAGSTHSGEDEIILEVYRNLKQEFKALKLIIAPRHPERNEHVFELIQKTKFPCAKRSDNANFENNEIILLDTMGELGKLYSICDIAFIAGSFSKTGGHNPLEATIFNKPTVSGPCIHNFKDIYAILENAQAGKVVKTKTELELQLKKLLRDKTYYAECCGACQKVFEENSGALEFVLKIIKGLV